MAGLPGNLDPAQIGGWIESSEMDGMIQPEIESGMLFADATDVLQIKTIYDLFPTPPTYDELSGLSTDYLVARCGDARVEEAGRVLREEGWLDHQQQTQFRAKLEAMSNKDMISAALRVGIFQGSMGFVQRRNELRDQGMSDSDIAKILLDERKRSLAGTFLGTLARSQEFEDKLNGKEQGR